MFYVTGSYSLDTELASYADGVCIFKSCDESTQTVTTHIKVRGSSSNYSKGTLVHEVRHLVNSAVTGKLAYYGKHMPIKEGIARMNTDQHHLLKHSIQETDWCISKHKVGNLVTLVEKLGRHTVGTCLVKYLDPKSIIQYMKDCRSNAENALKNLLQNFSFDEFKNWVKLSATFDNKIISLINNNKLEDIKLFINTSGNMLYTQDLTILWHNAIHKGSPEIVQYLLEHINVDVNAKNTYGKNIVTYTILSNRLDIFKLLFKTGKVNCNYVDDEANTLLHIAVDSGSKEIIKYLLGNTDIDVNVKNLNNKTALDLANDYSNMEIYALIENKQNGAKNFSYIHPNEIISKIMNNDFNGLKSIFPNGGNLYSAENLNLFLTSAIWTRSPEMVEYVLNNTNIDINTKGADNKSAVTYTILYNALDILKFLSKTGKVNYNDVDDNGNTFLHTAVEYGRTKILRYLLDNTDIDLNAKNNKNQTALNLVNNNQMMEIADLIEEKQKWLAGQNKKIKESNSNNYDVSGLNHDKDSQAINNKDNGIKTGVSQTNNNNFQDFVNVNPNEIIRAIKYNEEHTVKLLFEKGKVDYSILDNYVDPRGNTLLHIAVRFSQKESVKYLLKSPSIDVNVRDAEGKTALNWANDYRNTEIAALIENKQNDLDVQNNNMIKFYEDEGYASDSPLIGEELYTDSTSY